MIRPCTRSDLNSMYAIINDAAHAYKGVIPGDCWHEPYMSMHELEREIRGGVLFWGVERDKTLQGVMGIQDKGEVSLIRHAYVRTTYRNSGIGTALIRHLETLTGKTLLVGTWRAATWAIKFYEKHAYTLVSDREKDRLLKKYWSITARQIETSVVLVKSRNH